MAENEELEVSWCAWYKIRAAGTRKSSVAPRRTEVPRSADSRRVASRRVPRLVRCRADFRVYRRVVRASLEHRFVSRPRSVPSRPVSFRPVSFRLVSAATSTTRIALHLCTMTLRSCFLCDTSSRRVRDVWYSLAIVYLIDVCFSCCIVALRFFCLTSTQRQSHESSEHGWITRSRIERTLITRRRTIPLFWECERRLVLAATWSARTPIFAGNLTFHWASHSDEFSPTWFFFVVALLSIGPTSDRLSFFWVNFFVAWPAHFPWLSLWPKKWRVMPRYNISRRNWFVWDSFLQIRNQIARVSLWAAFLV